MNKITNDMSIVFNSVRNRSEMSAWIMRQWFNPDKHSMKAWYDSSVNANNVLSFVSHNKHFPMSPLQLVDMWSVMPTSTRTKTPTSTPTKTPTKTATVTRTSTSTPTAIS